MFYFVKFRQIESSVVFNMEYFPDSKTFSKPVENAFGTFHKDVHYIQSWESSHQKNLKDIVIEFLWLT